MDPKAKKGGDAPDIVETPLEHKRLIKLELLLDSKCVLYAEG